MPTSIGIPSVLLYAVLVVRASSVTSSPPPSSSPSASQVNWELVWADEFDDCPGGRPDETNWAFEHGFVRNHELQWYQRENAACEDGNLVIRALREHPAEKPEANYTASSLRSLRHWTYGRFEMRGRIRIDEGSWPAWWVLGENGMEWPDNGEVDIMEYYGGQIRANLAFGDPENRPVWNGKSTHVGAAWSADFHTWAMEWDEHAITLWLDGNRTNEQNISSADVVGHANPWRGTPAYMILNQAIGSNGGDPSSTTFPLAYEVDYVRVYQRSSAKEGLIVV
eukprot:TRINITY_DN18536_c0_g1_i1.p1 TRINITY_DN18536_c0_g1~~TRINITY_DN18536_c0_g1_i1.p1  ORF type:complete len:313 (+),score=33.35 TRINITY_DN18536_c0_g1_i1:98-940(+)